MFNDENMMNPLFPSDFSSFEEEERGVKSSSVEEMMVIPTEEYKPRNLYRTEELAEMYGISTVTISQYKNGINIERGDKKYVYEPIFIEGEDYIYEGGRYLYTESACQKIKTILSSKQMKKRMGEKAENSTPVQVEETPKQMELEPSFEQTQIEAKVEESSEPKKRGRKPKQKEETPIEAKVEENSEPKKRGRKALKETPQELVERGFILFKELCEKTGINYPKFYTEFKKFKNGEINGADGNPIQIEEGRDFISDGKRIALHQDLVAEILNKIQNGTRKPRTTKPREVKSEEVSLGIKSEEISLIYGSRIFKVTQEEAQRIIDVLSETSKQKMSKVEN